MPNIAVPIGSTIREVKGNVIKIQVRNTRFYVVGETKTDSLWDVYLVDPRSKRKDIIKHGATTTAFYLFCTLVLKSPFPYAGKEAADIVGVHRFIKKLVKHNKIIWIHSKRK